MKINRVSLLIAPFVILAGQVAFGQRSTGQTSKESGDKVQAQPNLPAGSSAVPTPESDSTSETYNAYLDEKPSRFNAGFFTQISQFSRTGQSLVGTEFEAMAGYALTQKMAFNVAIMQSLSTSGGISVLYSGIRSGISYAVIGEAYRPTTTFRVNGESSVVYEERQKPTLSPEVGFDQIFLNGTDRVTPATGISLGIRYDRSVWKLRMSYMARYGSLVMTNDKISLLTVGAGILYRF